MKLDARLEKGLAAPDPLPELRNLIEDLYAAGQTQPAILELFETARQHLRQSGRERDEDTIMEAMDFLVGWCSPHMNLSKPPQALTRGRADHPIK
jgi:hypothetical protein